MRSGFGSRKYITDLERLEEVLTRRVSFTLVYYRMGREIGEAVVGIMFVIEEDSGRGYHHPGLPDAGPRT